ncbi:hypothetical protein SARC_03645 [Sphaeroforma arctica JP610]|uniref:Uncharacterized protein n=1 Tax=Sphaeroforma arctica JP610 TaxID=667725 RepID=A0A0L0G5D3_9EUKA|nr:hypothetical protein SARC_03645 [Sphaeroforma arctica JP610]KNC84124.1 hypothetical protein SARC_03645 [Sphaeroforma arctica JP610]|eukprot:XP_014158026.1 hypothetical protein SARC_03645 [Sphaeroforma arctica JP610]
MASTNKNLTTASTNEEPMVEVSLENNVSDVGESGRDEKLDNADLPTLSVEMDKSQADAKTDGKEALDTPDTHLERRHQLGNEATTRRKLRTN